MYVGAELSSAARRSHGRDCRHRVYSALRPIDVEPIALEQTLARQPGSFRSQAELDGVLLSDMREITDARIVEERPHDALGSLPPARYRERLLAVTLSQET